MLTDSHCHLASRQFSGDVEEIVQRARVAGVKRMVTLATCVEDAGVNREIAESHEGVFFCAGIHPCDVHEAQEGYLANVERVMESPKGVGIGETGLDYFHKAPDGWEEESFRARQREFLDQHFSLAKKLSKPVVVHTRDQNGQRSFDDALDIYKGYASDVRAVFHCFIGNLEQAREVIALGGLVSFTGIATFPKGAEVLEVARQLGKGEFMVETDAPYLAPVPMRGKRCEPAYVVETAKKIAAARGVSLEDLAEETEGVVKNFFQLGEC